MLITFRVSRFPAATRAGRSSTVRLRIGDPLNEYRITPVAAFCVVLVAHGGFAALMGIRAVRDTPTYSRWADILIVHHFNYAYLQQQTSAYPVSLYSGFITLVAFSKLLFGESWGLSVGLINILAD